MESNEKKTKTEDNMLSDCRRNIESPPSEEQTLRKPTNQENIDEKGKDIIINNEKKVTLFGNDKIGDNKPLFEIKQSLFGENMNDLNDKNVKDLFGDNKIKEKKNSDNGKKENNIIFDNNEQLFEKNKNVFGDNNDKDNDNIFDDNNNCQTLFGDDEVKEFYNKYKSLFNDDNNYKSSEKNEEDNEESEEENHDNEKNDCDSLTKDSKKKPPEPSHKLIVNQLLTKIDIENEPKMFSGKIVSILHLNEPSISMFPDINDYVDIKELQNGNFFILFSNKFYYIISKTFKILNIDESLPKYCGFLSQFSKFEEINKELIGIISEKSVLIVQINNKEVKLFQEIEIKAKMIKSFPNENLIIINEYINEPTKNINVLNYYICDNNLKYQLKKKEEINFQKFETENINMEDFHLFNCITNMKKYKNGKIFFFTLSDILLEENQKFDAQYLSFYERDVKIFLNIYLYENQELTLIYTISYKTKFVYYEYLSDSSEYAEFLNFWRDQNILINEKDETIFFYISDLTRHVLVDIKEKKSKIRKYKDYFKKCIIDKKNRFCFIHNIPTIQECQEIVLYYQNDETKLILIKRIIPPYCLDDYLITKKGYLLGVAKKIVKSYRPNPIPLFSNAMIPDINVNFSLCLLNISY